MTGALTVNTEAGRAIGHDSLILKTRMAQTTIEDRGLCVTNHGNTAIGRLPGGPQLDILQRGSNSSTS